MAKRNFFFSLFALKFGNAVFLSMSYSFDGHEFQVETPALFISTAEVIRLTLMTV